MSIFNNGVEVLQGLGLTSCQAKIYLALCHVGCLEAKTISKHTSIARQDVYRITSDLEHLGLIKKVISRPTKFRATPLEKGISFLLKQKHKELDTIESKTESLLTEFDFSNEEQATEKPEFVWVPGKEAFLDEMENAIENTQTSIDMLSSYKRFSNISIFSEALEKAWSRGVKCRIIIGEPEKSRAAEKIFDFLTKGSCTKVRFIPSTPETVMNIYDQNEILLITNPNARIAESPALWSNNQSLVSGMQKYFTFLWTEALKKPKYNIDSEQD
jgi:sugar-specific transcriptional regulator TrmB